MAIFLYSHYSFSQDQLVWSTEVDHLGSFSSPRASDLNGDGTKDIIIGAGKNPFIALDSAVMAFDGKTGAVLWAAPSTEQMFGSPALYDISGDGVEDVFINGRSGVLKALNGRNGKLIWEFLPGYDPEQARGEGWYNFYNPQFVKDQDGDGVRDIVISNGGDHKIEAFDPNRPVGLLALISGKTGKLISKAEMPDGKETYLSIVAYEGPDGSTNIVYGTGGETIAGSLYVCSLKELKNGDLKGSKQIATSLTKGFIAPPVVLDLNKDDVLDVVCMAVDGRLLAVNGSTWQPLWSTGIRGTEAFASLAVGMFNGDDVPDFFTTVNTGVWPDMEYALSLIVDGGKGSIMKSDTVGYYQMVSPIAVDIDNNEFDEVILHTNFPQWDATVNMTKYLNTLFMYDFKNKMIQRFGPIFEGAKQASTPWIGDLDGDQKFDIVMLYQKDVYNESIFGGIRIMRMDLGIRMQRPVTWGSYMGSQYDGIYRPNH